MDSTQIYLARTLTDERLREALDARLRRTTWVTTPNRLQPWRRRLAHVVRRAASRPAVGSRATDEHQALVER